MAIATAHRHKYHSSPTCIHNSVSGWYCVACCRLTRSRRADSNPSPKSRAACHVGWAPVKTVSIHTNIDNLQVDVRRRSVMAPDLSVVSVGTVTDGMSACGRLHGAHAKLGASPPTVLHTKPRVAMRLPRSLQNYRMHKDLTM